MWILLNMVFFNKINWKKNLYLFFFFLGWVLLIEFKYYICDMKYYYIMIFDK